MQPLRVIQWSTGGAGAIALRTIARRPDLELAGVWVHRAAKVGRDAGELAGAATLGVAATNDAAAQLALAPDCVCYNGCRRIAACGVHRRLLPDAGRWEAHFEQQLRVFAEVAAGGA